MPMFGRTAVEKAQVDMWIRRIEFTVMMPVGMFWRHAHPFTAALLTDQPVILHNVPRIADVLTLIRLIESIGASVRWTADNTVVIHAANIDARALDPRLCKDIRASILLAGPLLGRAGALALPPPGGDVIGRRRLDTHFLALRALGATLGVGTLIVIVGIGPVVDRLMHALTPPGVREIH